MFFFVVIIKKSRDFLRKDKWKCKKYLNIHWEISEKVENIQQC